MMFFGVFRFFIQKFFPLPSTLPSQVQKRIHSEITTNKWLKSTTDIFSNVEEILKPFRNLQITNKPMIVISAGIHTEYKPEFRENVIKLQKKLVLKSTNGRQIIAERSSHNVPFVQPEIIVKAVEGMTRAMKPQL